ncbi:acylphosphatase [Lysinibacillus xylanilyticus]|uniref:Acylphosphatase n=1 Tax=Lysinibacillus xylanilyticus TaxID=582475 RepID=A0A0K9FDH7_9BACI|nr:acylphosphatase [Lysinibacillus xylanilyticus]KMY32253.1 acylphosphatase [Lysinibacillus xylanilyticus]MCY9549895.1 acylphosphatase [Lysinibacillus xylanilyticus]MED3803930.1 acylphosphatase [Lysinibacillus xylanilyticus]
MNKRALIKFFGDVYGTGYRFFIKQKAIELGLKGYCKLNNQDQIEVEVEGSKKALDEFLIFVQKGVSPQADSNSFTLELFDDLKGYTRMESDIV